jgi:hypothetical protein
MIVVLRNRRGPRIRKALRISFSFSIHNSGAGAIPKTFCKGFLRSAQRIPAADNFFRIWRTSPLSEGANNIFIRFYAACMLEVKRTELLKVAATSACIQSGETPEMVQVSLRDPERGWLSRSTSRGTRAPNPPILWLLSPVFQVLKDDHIRTERFVLDHGNEFSPVT